MYKYKHFIQENIAPVGATSIGMYDSKGKRVGGMSLGRLKPPTENKLYSCCVISDPHIPRETASTDFQRALTFAENNCAFTCVCGDLTVNGTDSELDQYKSIVNGYAKTKPVYAVGGNHDSIPADMTFNRLTTYTGKPMYYSLGMGADGNCVDSDVNKTPKVYGNSVKDVFIMLSHYGKYEGDYIGWLPAKFVSVEEIQWLYETLEANRDKRCFVFNHVYPYQDGVGDAGRFYGGKNWDTEDKSIGQAFINLLKHYKNTILFHGHSHLRLHLQEIDDKANYSSRAGYRSVHIPSLSIPRDRVNGSTEYVFAESEGYVVDVYENYIILNGRDFIDNDADGHLLPIATYKIDTTLQTIEPNTFVDNTGTITV